MLLNLFNRYFRQFILITIFITLGFSNSFSQITIDSVKESRCLANGLVGLSAASASGDTLWRIIDDHGGTYLPPGQLGVVQKSGLFTGLLAGTYTFQLTTTAPNNIYTETIVVPGTYLDPIFMIDTIHHALCPGQGEIHVEMSEGNDPYRFRLYHPDSTYPTNPNNKPLWQDSGIFKNLRAGTYVIEAEDSCGVIKTIIDIIVEFPNGGPLGYDYKGNTQVYYTDEAINIPQNCTQSTVGMYLRRNYASQLENSYTRDGNGAAYGDIYTRGTYAKPLELSGGKAPYNFTLTESKAYYLLPKPTESVNDYRPEPPFSYSTNSYSGKGRGIEFDVANDLTLYTAGLIQSTRVGHNVRISLYDNAGNLMYSKWDDQTSVTQANDNVASLGWFIPAGTGYELVIDDWNEDAYIYPAESQYFSSSPYPISAGDITVTARALTGANSSTSTVLNYFSSLVYSKDTTILQGPIDSALFSNLPRTNANSFTIVGEDACGSKIYRSVTTKIPLEVQSLRRTKAECGVGNDILRPKHNLYANLHQDPAQHYYTYPWMGNSIGGTLPYTYTVTSDIGYSPDPITHSKAMANPLTTSEGYYAETKFRNLDGTQWQPDPAATITITMTDACGEVVTETYVPPSGNTPIKKIYTVNDLNIACASWRRYRINHDPIVDTFETFVLTINTLTAGGAHADITGTSGGTGYTNIKYNHFQGRSMNGNSIVYPYFLPGKYEIVFTGACSGTEIKDTIEVLPFSTSFDAEVVQPCSNTPTASLRLSLSSGSVFPYAPAYYLYPGSFDPSKDYSTEPYIKRNISPSSSNHSMTGLSPGTYTVILGSYWTSGLYMNNCAYYRTVTVIPYKQPTLKLAAQPICNGTPADTVGSIFVTGFDGVPPYTYGISKTTIKVDSFASTAQSSPEFTNKSAGLYFVRILDSCGNSSVNSITTGGLFVPPIESPDTICRSSELRIETVAIPGASYIWYKAGVPIVGAPDSNVFVIQKAALTDSGRYWVRTSYGACTSDTQYHRVDVIATADSATASAVPDRFCEGDGKIYLTGGNTGATQIENGLWTIVSGPTSPLTPTLANVITRLDSVSDIVTTDGPPETPYIFRWEVDNGLCISNAYDTVYVHRKPTTAFAGNDQHFCEADSVDLNATIVSFGHGYWTQISGNPVVFKTQKDTSNPKARIGFSGSPIWPDTVTLKWTVVNDSTHATCMNEDEVSFFNRANTGTPNAGPNDTSCNDLTYQLAATPVHPDSGSGRWIAYSFPGTTPSFNNVQIPNAIATLNKSGEYKFIWEVSNGVCAPKYDTVTVFLIKADAGNDVVICMDAAVGIRMKGDTVPGIPGTWTSSNPALSWSPNGVNGSDSAIISGVSAGKDTVTYTVTHGGCTVSDDMIILASEVPSVSMAGPDQTGLCNDTALLEANVPVSGKGVWTQFSGPNTAIMRDFDSAVNVVEGLIVGIYKFVWTISSQPCTPEVDTVLIEVTRLPHTTLLVSKTDPYCINTGSITAAASPMVLPLGSYEYSITGPTTGFQKSPTFNGLVVGTYDIWSIDKTSPVCGARKIFAPVILQDLVVRPQIDTAYFSPVSTCDGTTNRGSITVEASEGIGVLTYSLTGSFTASNTTGYFPNLLAGIYTVMVTDAEGCPVTAIADLWLPEIECDTMYKGIPSTGGIDSTCLSTINTPGTGPYSIGTCDGSGESSSGITLSLTDSCVTYTTTISPFQGDTACIIICDSISDTTGNVSVVVCDTTTMIYYPIPNPDTIVTVLSKGSPPVVVCADTTQHIGSDFTYSACKASSAGAFNRTNQNCYTYIPLRNMVDTTCVIVCDEFDVCDTTVFIFIPPLTPDTVITTDTVVCVDTTEIPGGVGTITGCDGMSPTTSTGGGVTTIDANGCVTLSPMFGSGNTDTTCIIVCNTIAGIVICDTTIIITVKPPTPDTITQFTNGTTTDSCITTEELLGANLTYINCGSPNYGTMSNVDSCYKYVPTTNKLDTACTVICDEFGFCDTTVFIYIPPVTPDTVITTDTVVCVDTTEIPGGVGTITGCDGMSPTTSTGGGVATIDANGCVTLSPMFGLGNTDTTCIIVCNTIMGVEICDTTIIITVKPPTPDTITQLTNGMATDSCITTEELVGTNLTYINCGSPNYGTMSNVDSCYKYVPSTNKLDTACTIICDEFGICDTTVFIYIPPPVTITPDTIVTTDTVTCVDTTEILGYQDTITGCDGNSPTTSTGGGVVTIDQATGCVTTSPDFGTGNTDTTCIIVCKTEFGIETCDTTIIIIVKPPTPDTITQFTNGMTTDSCITTDELLGTNLTYINCGSPSYGTMSNVDSCYKYVPITNKLDTACTIICDEYGICDTTVFIYIPPVTPDTVITTDTLVCVDTTEIPGGVGTITGCDGMSPTSSAGGGLVTIDANGCVTTSPDFTNGNTDTTCIIVCNTIMGVEICDTTIIITVKPPTPDTITQLTHGMTTDTCLSTSELIGTNYTYVNCGNPVYGVLANNNDSCFTYTPITNELDTSCVIICDEYGICDTTVFIYIPPVTPDTVITTDTIVCVDTTEIPGGVGTITGCDGMSPTSSAGGGLVTIDANGCVTTSPDFTNGNTDTTCIIVCNTIMGVEICDTTIIITVKPPTPDTIIQITDGKPTDTCLSTSELIGTNYTYVNCGNPVYGVLANNNDSCFTYTPITNELDTSCVIICDEYGICDTTVFIYIPPVTPDTVITTDTIVCVDTTEIPGGVGTITGCDGMSPTSSAGGGLVIIDANGCVTTSPDFTNGNTDTTCIIVCNTIMGVVICDTTIIITVKPPTPDTITQFTNGMTTDSCITTDELLGTNLTYINCGSPNYGTMSNVDSCYKYVPITNKLDTACTIICDEYGICDTTVFIYIPPVTPDTVITTDTIVCVDTTEIPGGVGTITGCDGMSPTSSAGGGLVTIDANGCVTTSPDFTNGNTDTTCIIVCNTIMGVEICDTTIIITVKPPTPDTITQLTHGMTTDTCLSTSELIGTNYTYVNCGNPVYGVLANNNDSCFTYTPITNELDTSCVIICDEYGICDTTVFIYIPPVTPDTVITTDTIVCVDTTEIPGGVGTITGCDGMSPTSSAGGGLVTIDANGCVTTSPDFTNGNTDTTCIIVCNTIMGVEICDTTIIITVKPPTPDTIIQITDGKPTDTCLSTSELIGTNYTYVNCGNPVYGVLANNNDSCFTYTPITNELDTSCVIICDEYGICDTTVFIYVPPVTPDTIYTQDSVVCVDTTEMSAGYHTATGCDGMNPTTTSNGGAVTVDARGCATIDPIFGSGVTDTTCIVICDTIFGICDTTIIINKRMSVPDTIYECIPRDGEANDSNMNTNDLLGSIVRTSTIQLPNHGQFTLTDDTNSSYQTSPSPRLDTVTVKIFDKYGCYDMFTFIYIPPMHPDTIKRQGGGIVSVDTTEMPDDRYTSIGTCDGMNMTSNGGTVVPMSGGRVLITPDYTTSSIDTTCVVLCDSILPMCECDTTYIISFKPTIPDTFAILLPKGTNTADTCLSTSELFGKTYSYRRLGAPTPHGPVTTHNDTCINYVQTSTTKYLDTARVLICDECGNCDTTVIVYVPTPDPDTLFLGPVIPLSNADTCVSLESSYMTGMHIGTCDGTGTTSSGVPVAIAGLCVRYPVPPAVFTGDTTCIVVCDTILNITICDTTLIIYLPDTTPPTVICRDDTVYLDATGNVTIDTSNVAGTVYDNTLINSVWVTPTMFNCSHVGANSVMLYARDTNRNMDSCSATITVLDTIAPTAMCQNVTIVLDSMGNASITALTVDAGSFDNCAIASLTVSQTSFDCSHVGVNTVTLTVIDVNGNVSTCTSTVTVEDRIAPIVYCPADKQVILRNTMCTYIVEDFRDEVNLWDNCSTDDIRVTQSPDPGTSVPLDNTSMTVTITATDGSGNASTCTFEVEARCSKDLNIPQFISPTGSGQNDTWEIPELANYPNNTVKVFNRWGNLVFEQKGYYTGWDGSSNVDRGANMLLGENMLPEGTYFYIIDLGEGSGIEPYVGYMQIKR